MSDCCVVPHKGDIPTCPMNGQVTRPVGRQTVESLVKPEVKETLTPQPYYFCDAPDCDTVYVSAVGGGEEYRFCCQGCIDLFATDPGKYLEETKGLIVCPTCLAEKPPQSAVSVEIAGEHVHFCRCPYCVEVFQKNPDFYMKRLEGAAPNEGVLDHEGCCIRPE